MIKISNGAFPLMDIDKRHRKCIETYMIKLLSDILTLDSEFSSIHNTETKYITPEFLMNLTKDIKSTVWSYKLSDADQYGSDFDNDDSYKVKDLTNVYKKIIEIYGKIGSDPFYKNKSFYPIYLEHIKTKNGKKQHEYDFVLLTNDLIKEYSVDEIAFDERIIVMLFVLKDIIFPHMSLSEIGTSSSNNDFRRIFASYLEACKMRDVNPINNLVNFMREAGKRKLSGRGSNNIYTKITGKTGINKDFSKLFGTKGEIKDANYLVGLTQSQIADFVDPHSETNRGATRVNITEREYSQVKTHEYGIILSILDSLIHYNKNNNITEKINDRSSKLKTEEETFSIDIDSIVNFMSTTLFPNFVEGVITQLEKDIGIIKKRVSKESRQNNQNVPRTKKELESDIIKIDKEMEEIRRLILDADNKIVTAQNYLRSTDNSSEAESYTNTISFYEKEKVKLNDELNVLSGRIRQYGIWYQSAQEKVEKVNEARDEAVQFLSDYQSVLTVIHSEIYTYLYSEKFLNFLKENISVGLLEDKTLNNILDTQFNHLANEFAHSLVNQTLNMDEEPNTIVLDVIEEYRENILSRIEALFLQKFSKPLFKKYSNPSFLRIESQNLKIENDNKLKKFVDKANLFKSFILDENILIKVYDILHYLDTVKYESGLINNPVSRVHNTQNKIDFIISRLGLDKFPTFIVSDNTVNMSLPPELNYLGHNEILRIPKQKFLEICSINYYKELTNQYMFSVNPHSKQKNKISEKRNEKQKYQDSIKVIKDKLSKAKDKKEKKGLQDELSKVNSTIKKISGEIENLNKADKNIPSRYSSNIEKNKRSEYFEQERTGQQQRDFNRNPREFNRNPQRDFINEIKNNRPTYPNPFEKRVEPRNDQNQNENENKYQNQYQKQENY